MRIRHEINILDEILSAASGVSASSGIIQFYDGFNQYASFSSSFYLEVLAKSSTSLAFSASLSNVSFGNIGTVNIPTNTTSWTLFRAPIGTPNAFISGHRLIISNTSGATKQIKSAKLIIIQDGSIYACSNQYEIGNSETGKINTTSSPLNNPKYWYYDSSSYDGITSFSASVNWLTSTTKNTCDITLQEDDGSFGGWTDIVTIVSAGSNVTLQNAITTFTPTHGRNYRLASLGSTSKSTYSIYLAKILVTQTQTSSIQSTEINDMSETLQNPALRAYYRCENLNDTKGTYNLASETGITYSAGKFGNCFEFPNFNTHSVIVIGSSSIDNYGIHNLVNDEYTISVWFKMKRDDYVQQLNLHPVIFETYANVASQPVAYVNYSSGSGMRMLCNGAVVGSYPFLAGTSSWHNVVMSTFTGSGGSISLYLNGNRIINGGKNVINDGIFSGSIKLCFGNEINSLNRGIPAYIDEITVFKGRLSDSSIKSLYNDGLTKFETQYLLANTNFSSSGTNAQEYYTSWSLGDWNGVDNLYYHEGNSVAGGTSDIKLIKRQGSNDITNSTITDVIERERSSAITMPTGSDWIDVQATSNSGNLNASRIIVLSTKSSPIINLPPYTTRFYTILGEDRVVRSL